MRRRIPFSALALLLAVVACRSHHADQRATVASRDTAVADQGPDPELRAATTQAPAFEDASVTLARARPGMPPRVLITVQYSRHPGYDRAVFEFSGDSLPGYYVAYAQRGVRRCGSGDPVTVAGARPLLVRLEPAQAHDDRGAATIERRDLTTPELAVLNEMKLICDFEGQVAWAMGVAAMLRFRVLELSDPPRIVVDVEHPD